MKTEREIERMAMDYAKLCDHFNQTVEKQADIIQGYKAGFNAAKLYDNNVVLPICKCLHPQLEFTGHGVICNLCKKSRVVE